MQKELMSFNIFPWIGQLLSIPFLHVTILFVASLLVSSFFSPVYAQQFKKKKKKKLDTSSYFHCSVSKKACGVLCGL